MLQFCEVWISIRPGSPHTTTGFIVWTARGLTISRALPRTVLGEKLARVTDRPSPITQYFYTRRAGPMYKNCLIKQRFLIEYQLCLKMCQRIWCSINLSTHTLTLWHGTYNQWISSPRQPNETARMHVNTFSREKWALLQVNPLFARE